MCVESSCLHAHYQEAHPSRHQGRSRARNFFPCVPPPCPCVHFSCSARPAICDFSFSSFSRSLRSSFPIETSRPRALACTAACVSASPKVFCLLNGSLSRFSSPQKKLFPLSPFQLCFVSLFGVQGQNILMTSTGQVKLTDFGISKKIQTMVSE